MIFIFHCHFSIFKTVLSPYTSFIFTSFKNKMQIILILYGHFNYDVVYCGLSWGRGLHPVTRLQVSSAHFRHLLSCQLHIVQTPINCLCNLCLCMSDWRPGLHFTVVYYRVLQNIWSTSEAYNWCIFWSFLDVFGLFWLSIMGDFSL